MSGSAKRSAKQRKSAKGRALVQRGSKGKPYKRQHKVMAPTGTPLAYIHGVWGQREAQAGAQELRP